MSDIFVIIIEEKELNELEQKIFNSAEEEIFEKEEFNFEKNRVNQIFELIFKSTFPKEDHGKMEKLLEAIKEEEFYPYLWDEEIKDFIENEFYSYCIEQIHKKEIMQSMDLELDKLGAALFNSEYTNPEEPDFTSFILRKRERVGKVVYRY